ncbi:RNA 2',3'-cyclic phosphodiesterase [Radicibacter daui]|uniref:RNA 2',3'-cyclic phosphodiesterase n=1 Tax=Radicibacter daui TaxID=3064829 RepID=UPI004046FBDC
MLRLFVAIRFPEVVRERLRLLQGGIEGVAWTRPENLHLTLRFIGEVEEPVAADIDAALAGIAEPGFDLGLSGVGIFGTVERPRVLWAGVEGSAALMHLQAKVERAVMAAGLEPERQRYTPHVTLGRPAASRGRRPGGRLAQWLEQAGGFRVPDIPVGSFALMRSQRGSTGPDYQPLADYPLGAPG